MRTIPHPAQRTVPSAVAGALLGVYLLCMLLNLAAELNGWDLLSGVTVVLAMPLLMGLLLVSVRPPRRMVALMLLGLFFSWLGDVFGDPQQLKIVFFLAAQLAYVGAFLPRWRHSLVRRPAAVVSYAVVGLSVGAVLVVRSGDLAALVLLYGLSILAMAVLATGIDRWAAIGGLLFLLSDSLLGLTWFYQPAAGNLMDFLIMGSYLIAQVAIVLGVVRMHRTRHAVG